MKSFTSSFLVYLLTISWTFPLVFGAPQRRDILGLVANSNGNPAIRKARLGASRNGGNTGNGATNSNGEAAGNAVSQISAATDGSTIIDMTANIKYHVHSHSSHILEC